MTSPRSATIVDVAREAGVSKSLVSVALRGSGRVSEETRRRILEVAERLGYRGNALARSLVSGRTGLLGVIVTDLGNPYHADLARLVEAEAGAHELTAIILNGRREADHLLPMLDIALQLRVDALVVSSSWLPPEALTRTAATTPLAVIGRMAVPARGFDAVHNDDDAGTHQLLDHLAGLGHRRIAVLTRSARTAQTARLAAYRAWVAATGARAEEYGAAAPAGHDLAALVRRLGESDGPTAVFATNDAAAIDLLRACADAGLDVPGDVSVAGYDDTTMAALWRPGLTSLSQPLEAMARLAVDDVVTRAEGRTADRHDILLGELAIRGTTGPARA